MQATRATEQSQDSQRQFKTLDERYGKIGISAVAAAVRHQGERRGDSMARTANTVTNKTSPRAGRRLAWLPTPVTIPHSNRCAIAAARRD